jgi:hypothetical protein
MIMYKIVGDNDSILACRELFAAAALTAPPKMPPKTAPEIIKGTMSLFCKKDREKLCIQFSLLLNIFQSSNTLQ